MPTNGRIGAIDFWRGGVLVAILIDHIPGNGLEHLTPRNFGLSDSAEAFVFLSGLSVGAAYLSRTAARGFGYVAKVCGNRTLLLYFTHIGLTLAAIALFGVASALTGATDLLEAHGRGLAFKAPLTAAGAILALTHQLGYFNILPLYIVVMAIAPAIVALTLRSSALALAASLALYAGARLFGVNLPTAPEPGTWFFNPFAWQLIFTAGVVVARWRAEQRLGFNPAVLALSAAIVVMGAVAVSDAFGARPGLRAAVEPYLDLGKQDLGLGRLVNFAAIAYLLGFSPVAAPLVASRLGGALQILGRHSLPVFSAGSLLSAGGQALLGVFAHSALPQLAMPLAFVYTLASIAALLLLARRLECRTDNPPKARGESTPPSSRSHWESRPSFQR